MSLLSFLKNENSANNKNIIYVPENLLNITVNGDAINKNRHISDIKLF